MSGSILPQPYANCKLTSPDSSLQSPVSSLQSPRRETSWVMPDCESWSGVISIGPRETSRADVANSMEDSTRSKAQGIETFPDQSRPSQSTHIANQPGLPELADTGRDRHKRAAACAGSEDRLLEGHPCLLDLRAAFRFRPAFFPSPGTSIPALRAQSQPWNRICKSTHLPLWASTCRSLAPLAASLLPSNVAERAD